MITLALTLLFTMPVQAAAAKTCEVTLTVFDENVRPPFAHGIRLIEMLERHPGHRITDRDGATFTIETKDPDGLMKLVVTEDLALRHASVNGQSTPTFSERPRVAGPLGEDLRLGEAMARLPEGRYLLKERDGSKLATMFVRFGLANRPLFNRTLILDIDIWPGDVRTPQTEALYQSRSLGGFSNAEGTDGNVITRTRDTLILSYSMPYGIPGDQLTFALTPTFFSHVIARDQRIFNLVKFFPLKMR